MNSDNQETKKKFDDFIRYSNLAFEMIAIMAAGTGAGWGLDHWLGLKFPIFTLVLMVFSVVGAIYYAVRKFL